MRNGLEFKAGIGNFDQLMQNVEDSWLMATVSSVENNGRLLKQKEKAKQVVKYKGKNAKRWKHVVKFANEHQTVLKEECDNFYYNNPEEFAKERKKIGIYGLLLGIVSVICGGTIVKMMGDPDLSSSNTCLAATLLLASLPLYLFTAIYLSKWLSMRKYGPKVERSEAWDFLSCFKNNENIKGLWFKGKHVNTSTKDLCRKRFKKSEKELKAINSYVETKDWLEKWSRGVINNLHWVEWKALYGITLKYKNFLTPITVQQEQESAEPYEKLIEMEQKLNKSHLG